MAAMTMLRQKMFSNVMKKNLIVPVRFEARMPDALEHATGLEKRELLAITAGDPDPFGLYMIKRCAGTRDKPTCIPSAFHKRIMGCICHPDDHHIKYMWLHSDHMKRCYCGYWFKLVYKAPV